MVATFFNKKSNWWIVIFLLFLLIWLLCKQKPVWDAQNEWSRPSVLFSSSNSHKIGNFQAEVFEETIYLIKTFFDTTDHFLDYSAIFISQHRLGRESYFQQQISQRNYPAEQPVIFYDRFHNLHLFWGERRIDSNFEEWNSERPQIGKLSTELMYLEWASNDINLQSLYSGRLSFLGTGSLGGSARVTEDSKNKLHLVFQTDSIFQADYVSGKRTVGIPYVTYTKRVNPKKWNSSRFLVPGSSSDIIALSNNRLIISYLGLLPPSKRKYRTVNDILVLISDDRGVTWSEPKRVFLSGRKRGLALRMHATLNGKIHLVWGRQISSLPGPGEMWHAYSEDNGNSWTKGEAFLKLKYSSETVWHFIMSHDLISDGYGRVHWVGVIAKKDKEGAVNTLYYSMWNPLTKNWEENYKLNFASHPAQVQLSMDETSQELYIFWKEPFKSQILYVRKQLSKLPEASD